MRIELGESVDRVDRRHDAGGAEMMPQHRISFQCRQNGEGIGEPGALDHQPAERRYDAPLAPRMEIAHRVRQFAADCAAETPRTQQHHLIVKTFDEMMVDPDLAKFVDDDGGVAKRGIGEKTAQQRRLA